MTKACLKCIADAEGIVQPKEYVHTCDMLRFTKEVHVGDLHMIHDQLADLKAMADRINSARTHWENCHEVHVWCKMSRRLGLLINCVERMESDE